MTTTGAATDTGTNDRYPWVVMGIVLAGSYLVVLDTTVLGVALASIAEDLRADRSIGIEWVVTSYLVAVGIVQPATAWMSDRIGRRQVFIAALVVFTLASLVAGLAPNMPVLVLARLLQGLGGGAMMPVGMAMVWDEFPPDRRGMAMSVQGVASMAAPAFGPVIGGWMVTSVSWRYLFLMNVPIGAIALVLALRWLRDDDVRSAPRLDGVGWALVAATVVVLVVGARKSVDWGWGAGAAVAVVTLVLGFLSVQWLRRVEHPVLDLRLFSVRTFTLVTVINGLLTVGMYGRLAFLPTELQIIRGMSAQRVGVIFMFGALAIAATMPIGGWLVDRIGARVPVVVGQLAVVASVWELAHLSPTTSEGHLVFILVLGGLGLGLSVMAPQVAGMNALPPTWVSQATAMSSLTRQVAGAIGTAVLAAVIVSRVGAVAPADTRARLQEVQDAYNVMFVVVLWLAVVTVALSLALPGRFRARRRSDDDHAVTEATEVASGL